MTMTDIKEYHLVVTKTQTSQIIYHRDITEEVPLDLSTLDLVSYLDEVEKELTFKLSPELPYPGDGDITVTIGFSNNPPPREEIVWDSKDFYLEIDNTKIENNFDKWLASNYSPAGEDASNEQWFLSNSPHEFMPASLSTLKKQWESENYIQEQPEKDREYHLVVINSITDEIIYHRQLTEFHSLDINIYLDEIEQATEISLDPESIATGIGQYNIRIGFSPNSEDVHVWASRDYFISNKNEGQEQNEDEEVERDEPSNVTTFKITEIYLSLIFNSDATGLSDEDERHWEEFEQGMIANGFTNGHWSYPDDTEAYFSCTNDVHNLGDNVVDLQWVDMS